MELVEDILVQDQRYLVSKFIQEYSKKYGLISYNSLNRESKKILEPLTEELVDVPDSLLITKEGGSYKDVDIYSDYSEFFIPTKKMKYKVKPNTLVILGYKRIRISMSSQSKNAEFKILVFLKPQVQKREYQKNLLQQIPFDILYLILGYLTSDDLMTLYFTSSHVFRKITNKKIFWKNYWLSSYPKIDQQNYKRSLISFNCRDRKLSEYYHLEEELEKMEYGKFDNCLLKLKKALEDGDFNLVHLFLFNFNYSLDYYARADAEWRDFIVDSFRYIKHNDRKSYLDGFFKLHTTSNPDFALMLYFNRKEYRINISFFRFMGIAIRILKPNEFERFVHLIQDKYKYRGTDIVVFCLRQKIYVFLEYFLNQEIDFHDVSDLVIHVRDHKEDLEILRELNERYYLFFLKKYQTSPFRKKIGK